MVRLLSTLVVLSALTGCSDERDPEGWQDWYGAAGPMDEDVREPILYTADDYAFDDFTGGVDALNPLMEDFTRKFAPGDDAPSGCDGWESDNSLPREFWAVVTLHPRLYYKGTGCTPNPVPRHPVTGQRLDSEEKYYGNFFVEDNAGGMFVLNDSKVAHFQMGDRVRMRVRGVGQRFGLPAIVSHDILEVDRGPHAISFSPAGDTTCAGVPQNFNFDSPSELLTFGQLDVECEYDDEDLLGKTVRASGVVLSLPDTFGGFHIRSDDGNIHQVSLDSELNRRKWSYPVGTRVEATGPVLNAFGHNIVIMKVGQVAVLD